ncbi:hypothetical protein [Thermus thermamylovorans]|uniref:Uncharacterized protein n=1 Tax=Thermus thermamylovorans TaxID=2509362 RepID=A0A4Q9B060_9DEIN|nr:hypothetical protein [Thermus thermamylovorans]TBH17617.1 hypothetical protein ETP66_08520 [Thermus thermamylovorans]
MPAPRWLALLLALGPVLGEGGPPWPGPVLHRCWEVVRGLEVQALYRENGVTLVLLGRERPYLLLALEGGGLRPHPGPPRGRPLPRRPLAFLGELSLARRVVVLPREYRCFVLHRGLVVGVLRLGQDLEPLPLPEVPKMPPP